MPKILEGLKSGAAYAFISVGIVWLVVAYVNHSYLVLWPVVTSLLSGVLLKARPGHRLTWAWASSSAVLGLLLAAYQAYAAVPLVGGPSSLIASESLGGFAVFAAVHLILLYAGGTSPARPT
jgi:hypothetical protein